MRNIAVYTNLKKTPSPLSRANEATRLSIGLGVAMGLMITTTLSSHAAIPVESRPLTAASSAAADTSQTSQLWQLNQQIQKLQNEVRELRGKVETHDNDIDQLQKEAKNRYTDFDQRIAQSQEDIKKLQAAQSPTPVTTPPVDGAPVATAPGVLPATAATPATAGDEADKVAYIAAYDAYKAGGAAKAIAPMKKFIADYPNSPFVPNAYYWLGEFNLAITPPNFAAASSNFKIVSTQYPKTAKAAAATYRLATLADVDQHQAAAIALMKTILKNYPGTQEAGYAADYLKSHASTEEKKVAPKKTEKVKTEEATNQKAKPVVKKKAKTEDDASA